MSAAAAARQAHPSYEHKLREQLAAKGKLIGPFRLDRASWLPGTPEAVKRPWCAALRLSPAHVSDGRGVCQIAVAGDDPLDCLERLRRSLARLQER